MLACSVCPACLATYTKLFSALGVTMGLDEATHRALLTGALELSIGVSAWRSWRRRRAWPLVVALAGTLAVIGGHLLGESHALEWAGVLILLAGGLVEQWGFGDKARAPSARSAQHPAP